MTEEEERELIEQLRDTGMIECFPLPKHFYKKYDISFPKAVSFKEFVDEGSWFKKHFDGDIPKEIRSEPAPGGVRPLLDVEAVKVETVCGSPTAQSACGNQQDSQQSSAYSTESIEQERQQSEGHPSPHSSLSAEQEMTASSSQPPQEIQ